MDKTIFEKNNFEQARSDTIIDFLDNLPVNKRLMERVIVKKKNKQIVLFDVKEYKRQYYLNNIEIYRERNRQYRKNHKKTSKK